MLGCAAFIMSGLCWIVIFSSQSEPKVDVRLDNKRMSLTWLNGTGVDPAGQMFKESVQREDDQNSQEESTPPPRRRRGKS